MPPETPNLAQSSGASFLHRGACFAVGFAAFDRLALVVRLLALGERERDLDPTILEIHPGRDDRHPLLGRLANQLPDLLPVKEQLATSQRFVVAGATVAVRADVDVVDPD